MLRIVLDTSVITSAFRSRAGASFAILREIAFGRLVPLVTTSLLLEYEEVLKRPEQLRASGLASFDIDRALGALSARIEPVDVHLRWRPQLRDAEDEMVLEAAINGRADALVTHNTRDFASIVSRFGIRLLRPSDLLQEMRR